MRTHSSPDGLDDHTAEALLADLSSGDDADAARLASFIAALRSEYSGSAPVRVRTELAEIFANGTAVHRDDTPASDVYPCPNGHRSRRRTLLATLSAFVATLTGKILLGSAAVAAGVGGAHATGVVDVPGLPDRHAVVEDAPEEGRDGAGTDNARPDSPGVDGDDVADRATSGEPREDGNSFGSSIADEAVEGTPAEELRENRGEAAGDRVPEGVPARGSDTADEHRPDTPDGADAADEDRPKDPAGDTGAQPDEPPTGGADTADNHRSTPPTAAE